MVNRDKTCHSSLRAGVQGFQVHAMRCNNVSSLRKEDDHLVKGKVFYWDVVVRAQPGPGAWPAVCMGAVILGLNGRGGWLQGFGNCGFGASA